ITPARYNMTCKAGVTFRKSFVFQDGDGQPLDFTGFTARMQVRSSFEDEPLVSLSTGPLDDDGLTGTMFFDVPEGRLTVRIEAEVTEQFPRGSYRYDIEVVSPAGIVDSPLFGRFKVLPEVTRIEG